jgi:hypothetical protein
MMHRSVPITDAMTNGEVEVSVFCTCELDIKSLRLIYASIYKVAWARMNIRT